MACCQLLLQQKLLSVNGLQNSIGSYPVTTCCSFIIVPDKVKGNDVTPKLEFHLALLGFFYSQGKQNLILKMPRPNHYSGSLCCIWGRHVSNFLKNVFGALGQHLRAIANRLWIESLTHTFPAPRAPGPTSVLWDECRLRTKGKASQTEGTASVVARLIMGRRAGSDPEGSVRFLFLSSMHKKAKERL